MEQRSLEYRYGPMVRRQAVLWLTLSTLLFVGLLAVLTLRWAEFAPSTKALGAVLLIGLLFTVRAQLGRLVYRCYILPDRVQIAAPLSNRSIAWTNIVEVRRIRLPQVGNERSWACTVFTRNRHERLIPTYLFDQRLEQAEEALRQIVRHTPHAQHTNI